MDLQTYKIIENRLFEVSETLERVSFLLRDTLYDFERARSFFGLVYPGSHPLTPLEKDIIRGAVDSLPRRYADFMERAEDAGDALAQVLFSMEKALADNNATEDAEEKGK